MTPLYLIAHVVRGSPAFDIAIRCDDMGTTSDPGPWWLIPTSGHRAYPYAFVELEWACSGTNALEILSMTPDGPWPDHYTTHAAKGEGRVTAKDLLSLLTPPRQPVQRKF